MHDPDMKNLLSRCHAPGVFFDLPAEEYHADPSLGSHSIIDIRRSPRYFWKRSWMNPKYEPDFDETPALVVGTALHMMVLEGQDKFAQHYVQRPISYNIMSQGDKTLMTKAMKANLGPNQHLLTYEEYELCMEAAREIADHDDMRTSLQGGQNEVSIFWRDRITGVPCKGRLDRLKARGIGDLKSIANKYGKPLEIAAGWDIKAYRYDLQAAHYLTGIAEAVKALCEGKERDLVDQIKASLVRRDFGYQLVFLEKSQEADVWSLIWSPQNPLIKRATDQVHWAIETFRAMYLKHGTDKWPATWRLSEMHSEDIPGGEYGWY